MESTNTGEFPFGWMFPRIQPFLNDTLSNDDIDDEIYVEGTNRIEFFAPQLRQDAKIDIEEYLIRPFLRNNDSEEALFERLLHPSQDFNLLVLLGGLGAGKSTTVKYILRRFKDRRDQLASTFKCNCNPCLRKPIYFDFRHRGQDWGLSLDSVVPEVFRQVRLTVYERLITEWLQHNGHDEELIRSTDPNFLVLRRLLIANDLLFYHGSELESLTVLYDPDLRLDAPLMSLSLGTEKVIGLIKDYRRQASAYGSTIEMVSRDAYHSQDLMGLTLRLYVQQCSPNNPMNLIVLDNLDQLPTRHIDKLLEALHDLASHTKELALLVPLRPSSISPHGFVRDVTFRYHYGPNNFLMILSRLERFILSRPRKDLKVSRAQSLDSPFPTEPSDREVDALLVVAYLYARIMAAGINSAQNIRREINIHTDHTFLRAIDIGGGALLGLAETSDALVGACCRYGLDLLRRFFDNAYSNPELLRRAITLRSDSQPVPPLKLTYPDLVTSLLRDPVGGARTSRVANLFRPTRVTSNPGWPTLAKLRILSLLTREKRQEVGAIIQRLGLLGIPAEVTIEALNSLQDKFRLLIWLSTNRPLTLDDPSAIEHDVVISEHGERYFRRVVGDFEYVWFCATALQERQYGHKGLMFTVKLNDYQMMIHRVGLSEWKQICFFRFRQSSLSAAAGIGPAVQMEVLNVLYSSLRRALLGAGIAMRVHGDSTGLAEELTPLVERISDDILFWQKRYEVAYGSNFYLSVYEQQISNLQHEILDLRRFHSAFTKLEKLSHALHRVEASWQSDVASKPAIDIEEISRVPEEDLVTLVARYGRGLFHGLDQIVTALDKQKKVSIFLARFIKTRGELANLLESRVPTFSEVSQYTSYLLQDIKDVVASGAEVAATGEEMLRWCLDEKSELQKITDLLKECAYDVPELCKLDAMSQLKERFNNILTATERLARHLGVSDVRHLSERWSQPL